VIDRSGEVRVRWPAAAAACAWWLCAAGGCSGGGDGQGAAGRSAGRTQGTTSEKGISAPAPKAPPAPEILIDTKARRVSVPVRTARQGTYAELKGAIEYVLVSSGGKEYETIFTTDRPPSEIRAAFERVGLRRGSPGEEDSPPQGKPVRIYVEYDAAGKHVRRPVDELIGVLKTSEPLAAAAWVYTGSVATTDPATGRDILQADLTRSIVGLHYGDPSPLVQNPRAEAAKENVYRAKVERLPPATAEVRLVFERVMPVIPAGTRRVRVLLGGRVQGVGFRAFTQRQARTRRLAGFVRNLPDGRVEAVAEGPAAAVGELLAELKRGPRAARVERMDVTDEPPEGDLKGFEIRW